MEAKQPNRVVLEQNSQILRFSQLYLEYNNCGIII